MIPSVATVAEALELAKTHEMVHVVRNGRALLTISRQLRPLDADLQDTAKRAALAALALGRPALWENEPSDDIAEGRLVWDGTAWSPPKP